MHACIGLGGIDVRAAPSVLHQTIAYGIFDAQRNEVEATQRAADCRDVDPQREPRIQALYPRQRLDRPIDIFLASIRPVAELPQHPACDAALEIRAVTKYKVAGKADAAYRRRDGLCPKLHQLIAQNAFQPPRTGSEELQRASRFSS